MIFEKSINGNSLRHQKDTGNTARSYSFAFIRYLWFLFYGTVKAYHNLEVVFTLRMIVTRQYPITLHM